MKVARGARSARERRELRATAFHEAGHAVVEVLERRRVRRLALRLIQERLDESRFERQFRPGDALRLARLETALARELSRWRRGRALRSVSIKPGKGFEGISWSLWSPGNPEYGDPKDHDPLLISEAVVLAAGNIVQQRFVPGSQFGAQGDHYKIGSLFLSMLGPAKPAGVPDAVWDSAWRSLDRRVHSYLKRPEVRSAFRHLVKELLVKMTLRGREAEEIIRRALGKAQHSGRP